LKDAHSLVSATSQNSMLSMKIWEPLLSFRSSEAWAHDNIYPCQ